MTDPHNQTTFAAEEPIFESTEPFVPDIPTPEQEQAPTPKRRKLIIAGALVAVVLFGGGVGLALMLMRPDTPAERIVSELPTEVPLVEPTDELVLQFRQVQSTLEAADPSRTDLSFPPINWDIWLDQPER